MTEAVIIVTIVCVSALLAFAGWMYRHPVSRAQFDADHRMVIKLQAHVHELEARADEAEAQVKRITREHEDDKKYIEQKLVEVAEERTRILAASSGTGKFK